MSDLFEQDAVPMIPDHGKAVVASELTSDKLLAMGLDKVGLEVLERFIALRNAEEERRARIAFEEHFSKMRAELPGVAKKKDNGATKSKYAPVEDIQRACDPVIHAHGFSYSWREEALPNDTGKRVWMDISGYGHTRSNFFDCPKISGNNAQNPIQVAGAMSTYGRRYTFISGFGIIVEGEDSDGQISDDITILRLEMGKYLEMKRPDGSPFVSEKAAAKCKAELDKEDSDIDIKRLKAMYKWLRDNCEARK